MTGTSWAIAPLPENEAQRLEALRHYQILDTAPEIVFDRLTRMAARRFDMPIALVSLIDEKRQWFKSHHGLDATETPRDLAFCAHVILQDEVMVVSDTTTDPRFAGNPLVTGNPDIRFYAGAPLTTPSGHNLGTVCIIDRVPHPEFSEAQKKELAELAAIAMDEMELRIAVTQVKRDLEVLKSTQHALDQARAKAEQIVQEKSHFIANISHELRTPMNGILGMAYLLSDTNLDPVQRGYIDTITHSGQNLLLLVNDVLDLSKIEAHELILENSPFDIKTSFTQAIKLLKPLADKKGITLQYDIDPDMPQRILGDPGRIVQIVTNLVGNAVKFTDYGSVTARLRYDAKYSCITCEVKDTGIGIPENKRNAIFEKFVQGDTAITQKYGGTGLGLTITKQLVVMLGGEIGFESQENAGSRFWFTLPAALPDINTYPSRKKNAFFGGTGTIPVREARLLVVEDNAVNQLFLVKLLKKFGFTMVDVASNGIKALEQIHLTSHSYHAILMDCMMPAMDGYEATALIRKHELEIWEGSHVPIIAMTANALAGDREKCFAAGMDEYLSKPLQPDVFREMLGRWFAFPGNTPSPLVTDEPTTAAPPMNVNRLNMVAATDTEKTALMSLFFRLADEAVATMENSRRGDEFLQWKQAAHSLKGSAANLGMAALSELCQQSENASSLTYEQRSHLLQGIKDELRYVESFATHQNPPLFNPEV